MTLNSCLRVLMFPSLFIATFSWHPASTGYAVAPALLQLTKMPLIWL
jgi:hypothetical protein